jgi:hypothetical protein
MDENQKYIYYFSGKWILARRKLDVYYLGRIER